MVLFYFIVCISTLSACMPIHHEHAVPQEATVGVSDSPGIEVEDACEFWFGC